MLTLIDIIEEELDELIELEEDLAEDGLTLEDFYEWTDQLDEKESQAISVGRESTLPLLLSLHVRSLWLLQASGVLPLAAIVERRSSFTRNSSTTSDASREKVLSCEC